MKNPIPFLLLLVAAFTGSPAVQGQKVRSFQPEWLPETGSFRSGMLQVPENHEQSGGSTIDIAYVVVPAQDTLAGKTNPPLIFFSGGPGGNTLGPGMFQFILKHPFREQRDIILFDQRGIGYSSPMPDMSFDSWDILARHADADTELALTRQMLNDYRQRCARQGIHPEYYNTQQNARDVGMLFDHLGYPTYVLFGGSYGTRLARVVQDLFPERIHCSVLDSPAPMSGDFLLSRLESFDLALNRIFEATRDTLPGLEEDYMHAIYGLEAEPMRVVLDDSIPFVVNSQDGVYLIRRVLYQDNARQKAPALIRAFLIGDPGPVQDVLAYEYALTGGLNLTMLLSVEKYENYDPGTTGEAINRYYSRYSLFPVRLGFFDAFYRAGMDWHPASLPIAERHFEPSAVPTLIFVNRFDPVTPPENGELFMKDLSRGRLLILDEDGHGGGNYDCKVNTILSFMENPLQAPDTSCLRLYQP
ncbi:alpha/beta fold hydrolase [Robiginitalea sp. M366]|uniref:alpha/beta hydrolase n=1 Tax=Robiginitalea aestuariiviva TaxID=3036903 RepID=UPI00240DDDFC|nr:alpha/beta fold hydrolase [Robiginitalea aestuariiviva]MDG1572253.1 alpha/beta fold hydrolase [Robiginitalea aestuariiviva]